MEVMIDETEVEAKNLVIFATKKILRNKETAKVDVGYYEDIPDRGEPNILKLNPDFKPERSLPLKFMKEGKQPLTISFNGTDPEDTWYTRQGKAKQEIPWQSIALSEECIVSFVLQRRTSMDSFCKFSAQQGNHDPIKFEIELEGILSRDECANRTVSSYILQHLARELTSEWEILARYLNISDGDLYNINENNPRCKKSAKYFMLHQWRGKNGAGATCRVLATALDMAGRRDLREYVERQDVPNYNAVSQRGQLDLCFVRFKVDLADHLDVLTIQRLSILLGLKPGEIESIKRSKTPGLEMVNLLDIRGVITPTGITDLLKMLHKLKLAGLAERIHSSFQAKTYQGKKDHGLYLEVEQQEDKSGDVSSKGKPPDVLPRLHESLQKVFAEMTSSDSENLANFFMFPLKHVKAIVNSPSHSKDLLVELENKGIIQSALTDELFENLGALNILTGRNEGSKSSIYRPSSTFLSHEEDWKPPDTMKIKSSISEKGGLLQIPNTGIKLVFPPNAVTEERNIQVKIIPPSLLNEPATSFSSNSSVVLELLPNGLQLKRDVSLTLPHCLTFANEENAKAKVYVSHHEEGQRPRWEERPLSPYIFYRSKCTVRLLGFCWLKIEIDDREVVAKNIVVYATKKILQNMETSRVSYGYYEDIPDREPKILNLNPDLKLVQSLLFTIFKEGKQPITISFNGTYPRNSWAIEEGNEKQEMPWGYIDLSKEFLVHFELQRRQSRDSFCKFTAQQGNSDPVKFSIAMEGYLSRGEIADSSVPDYILQYLAEELCSEWESLARYLKISQGDLDNVKRDNRRCHQDTKYFMLDKWKKRNGTGATCRVLATALDKAGRRDLREYVESQVPMQSGSEPTHQHGWFRGWLKWFKW